MTESTSGTRQSKPKGQAAKFAGALSMLLWVVGFVFLFSLAGTPLIWLSDTLLLLGFWPLLFVWRAGWTWLVFGFLNIFISFVLELTKFITLDKLAKSLSPETQAAFLAGQKHLAESHPFMPWFFIGIFSVLFGSFRVVKTICRFIAKQRSKSVKAKTDSSNQ